MKRVGGDIGDRVERGDRTGLQQMELSLAPGPFDVLRGVIQFGDTLTQFGQAQDDVVGDGLSFGGIGLLGDDTASNLPAYRERFPPKVLRMISPELESTT